MSRIPLEPGRLCFLPLYSEDKQYEVRWLLKPTPPPPAEVRTFSLASSDSRVATAVGGAGGRRSGRRGGLVVAGVVTLVFVEAQADVALQGRRGQPLLGEAALQEGDAGAEVGQPVDPTGDFSPTQQLQRNVRDNKKEAGCADPTETTPDDRRCLHNTILAVASSGGL